MSAEAPVRRKLKGSTITLDGITLISFTPKLADSSKRSDPPVGCIPRPRSDETDCEKCRQDTVKMTGYCCRTADTSRRCCSDE